MRLQPRAVHAVVAALAAIAVLVGILAVWAIGRDPAQPPIRVGLLHSLSGTMAVSERPLADAVRLAVDEINARGGLLGRRLEIVAADGKSDPATVAAEAARLIEREKVSVLFACWTSACRKAVKPVIESHRHLMFYAVQYEGLEQSPNIVYTGSAPNQQIVPGTRWALETFGKRVYLVGSDYIFPHTANIMIRDLIAASGGRVLAERYLPLGATDMAAIVEEIGRERPDVIFNTVNGDSNAALFAALSKTGLGNVPLVSFSVAEPEMKAWHGGTLSRHYGVWNYFGSLDSDENRRFVAAWRARFGADRATSDPIEATYVGVHLWAQAVSDAGSADPERVNLAIVRQTLAAPSGIAAVDARTRHLWKTVRVGKARPDGEFAQVFASTHPLRPAPWPFYRRRDAWASMVEGIAP